MTDNYSKKLADTEKMIHDYFVCCDSLNDEDGKKIVKPYTLSGLLCYIGITRKDFEKLLCKKSFSVIFNRALAKIEAYTEEKALIGALSSSAASNTLKNNFGWNESKSVVKEGSASGVLKIVLDGELMKLAE